MVLNPRAQTQNPKPFVSKYDVSGRVDLGDCRHMNLSNLDCVPAESRESEGSGGGKKTLRLCVSKAKLRNPRV